MRGVNTAGYGEFSPTLFTGTTSVSAPSLQLLSTQSPGLVHVQFAGSVDVGYTLEVSSDLTTWSDLATNLTSVGGVFSYDDAAASNAPARFYRLRWP